MEIRTKEELEKLLEFAEAHIRELEKENAYMRGKLEAYEKICNINNSLNVEII